MPKLHAPQCDSLEQSKRLLKTNLSGKWDRSGWWCFC